MSTLEELQQEARDLLAQFSVIAEAPAADPGGGSGGGKPGSRDLSGLMNGPGAASHSRWRAAFLQVWNDESELRREVDRARAELDGYRKGPPPSKRTEETEEEFFARIVRAGRGWSLRDCARAHRTSEGIVKQARIMAACTVEDGEPMEDAEPAVDVDKLAEARRLRDLGVSYRAIGPQVGMTGEGVRQMLKRAA